MGLKIHFNNIEVKFNFIKVVLFATNGKLIMRNHRAELVQETAERYPGMT